MNNPRQKTRMSSLQLEPGFFRKNDKLRKQRKQRATGVKLQPWGSKSTIK